MDATIAAISTAMSASGIGIVRISGENAMDVIAKIYRSKNGKKDIRTVVSHTIHYGFIYDGEEVVDEVLVMIMRGPHTYTGEDTVEIDCHGGVDEHSRNQAVRVLQEMAEGSRLIGIISHVSELKQEIEDQLIVSKDEKGSHVKWQIS